MTAPADIQQELSRVWNTLEGAHKMRASLFNLIIYTQKTSRDSYLHTVAHKVIEQFPCRILFISVEHEATEEYLRAKISLMYAGKEPSAIACDLIELEVGGAQLKRIPFIILPHLLPDLPIYLVWEEDPSLDNPIFEQMSLYASRLIFDSESTYHLPAFSLKLLDIYKEIKIDIADLNWARMENWRHLLTAHFYSSESLEKLQKVNEMTIFYNSHETASFCHTRIQAIYLQAWLSCQLEWQWIKTIKKNKDWVFVYQNKKDQILITLSPEDYPHLAPGIITAVTFSTKEDHQYSFTRHKEAPNHIVVKIGTPQKCELPTLHIFAKGDSGQSLVKEICHKGMSSHYLKVLDFVSKMENPC